MKNNRNGNQDIDKTTEASTMKDYSLIFNKILDVTTKTDKVVEATIQNHQESGGFNSNYQESGGFHF